MIQILPQKRKIQVKEKDVLIIFSFFWFYQVIRHWGKDSNRIFKDGVKNGRSNGCLLDLILRVFTMATIYYEMTSGLTTVTL